MDKIAVLKVYNLEFDHCTVYTFSGRSGSLQEIQQAHKKIDVTFDRATFNLFQSNVDFVKTFLRNKLEAQFQWGGAA